MRYIQSTMRYFHFKISEELKFKVKMLWKAVFILLSLNFFSEYHEVLLNSRKELE